MFALEKLKVHDKALSSAASLAQCSGLRDKRHSVSDQLLRASESLALNLAEAARLRSAAKRQHQLDYAIGSATEGSVVRARAYLELWARSGAIDSEQKRPAMDLLGRIASMLRGLASS
jgi:four helix bundle protein